MLFRSHKITSHGQKPNAPPPHPQPQPSLQPPLQPPQQHNRISIHKMHSHPQLRPPPPKKPFIAKPPFILDNRKDYLYFTIRKRRFFCYLQKASHAPKRLTFSLYIHRMVNNKFIEVEKYGRPYYGQTRRSLQKPRFYFPGKRNLRRPRKHMGLRSDRKSVV